ncbi:MAG: hypothetical protein IT433_05365 [Phycisphaerales bacterium]|nr:hypothetical protein [Phycisphaerales bacterium]
MTAIHCLRCGYDLSGLDLRALCPECTLPVARSQAGDLLRYADAGYLGSLRAGLTVLAVTAGAQAALSFISCASSVAMPLTGANLWNQTTVLVWAALWTVLLLADVVAAMLLARSDPGQLTAVRGSGLRVSLIVVAALLALGQIGTTAIGQWAAAPPDLAAALGLLTQAVHVAFIILLVRHLMGIARRIPSERLASSLMAVLVFTLVVAGLSLVSQITVQVVARFGGPSSGFWRVYPWFTTPVSVMRAGVLVWSIVLFLRLSREIAREAAAGRAEQPPDPIA